MMSFSAPHRHTGQSSTRTSQAELKLISCRWVMAGGWLAWLPWLIIAGRKLISSDITTHRELFRLQAIEKHTYNIHHGQPFQIPHPQILVSFNHQQHHINFSFFF